MFPVKPVFLLFWRGELCETPPCCLDQSSPLLLSFFLLSRLVLSVTPFAALAHPRQSHRDLSCRCAPERQRVLSTLPASLCVPLSPAQPGFGSVNPLLFSPPLSLVAPGAAPLLFIHPKHCWGTPACVLMHCYDHHGGIGFYSIPFLPGMIAFPLNFLLFPLCVCCPACCIPAVYTLPTILSVPPLCFCVDVDLLYSFHWFCLVVKNPVNIIL